MFNWLSVIVLLPIEIAGGYLRRLTGLMVEDIQGNGDKAPDMLKAITKPLTDHVVEINKDIIKDIASKANDTSGDVLKRWCKSTPPTIHHTDVISVNCDTIPNTSPLRHVCDEVVKASSADKINVSMSVLWDSVLETNKTEHLKRCDNLFAQTDLDDSAAGAIILVISLVLLLLALFLIVKLLNSLLSGSVTKVIKKTINADFPGVFAYFTPYVALLVGCGMTMIVQSSSVFTSTLTPLVGLDIVSVERMYPMTLGSNVGTTITAILAALSQSPDHVQHALQIALCHLFFNISGIILFFPLPFMRWPITFAKILGKTTAKHRWFAIFYIIAMFIILPGAVFGLSLAGWIYLAAIGGPILLFFLLIVLINVLQRKFPRVLPTKLQNWNFLPEWCHSLKPVDRLIERIFRCNYCKKLQNASKEDDENSQETETEVSTDDVESFKKQNGISNNGGLAVMSHEDESLKDSKHFTDPKYGVTNQGFHGDTRM